MENSAAEKKSDEKRLFYVQKAAVIFAKKGYHQCGVVELARELSLSKGGFYWYFPSKTDLYIQVCQLFCTEHQQTFLSLLSKKELNADTLLDVSSSLLQSLLADPLHLGLLLDFYSEAPRQPEIYEALLQLDTKWVEILAKIISRLQKDGHIGSHHDARELALKNRAFFSGIIMQFSVHHDINLSLRLWAEHIKDLERQET